MRQPAAWAAYAAALILAAAAGCTQDAPWGPEAAGLRASIAMPTTVRVGEAILIAVRIKNVSDKPTTVSYPTWFAGSQLDIRNEKGERFLLTKECLDRAWVDPKTFFHPLKPGETYAAEIRGRLWYQTLNAAQIVANADRSIYFDFGDVSGGLVRPGKFTVTLRHAVGAKTAEEGKRLGFDPVWTGELASNTIELSLRAMTREELDGNVARLRAGTDAEKREAVEVAAAAADRGAVRALMDLLSRGEGPLLPSASSALIAVQDASVLPELMELYRKSLREPKGDPGAWTSVLVETIRCLEPDRAKVLAFLLDVLRSDAPVETRSAALRGLWGQTDPAAFAAMAALAKKPEPQMQWAAIYALGWLSHYLPPERKPAVTQTLVEIMKSDPDPSVRSRAAEAQYTVGDPAAAPALIDALGDKDASVGRSAAFALGVVGGPDALAPLEAWAKGKSAPTQNSAHRAIDAIRLRHPATTP